jgi:hypothetical protein
VSNEHRPTEAQIRRALAECMTVGDIDDAMGWKAGTARRRRWRDAARGGLPFADAELGGVALWFRSTVEAWQERTADRSEEDEDRADEDTDEPGSEEESGSEEEPEPEEPEEPEELEPEEPESDAAVLVSGFELEPGQQVLVEVRGRWWEAHVRHRDRASVAVDYTLDGTPAGLRRQRVGLARIRVPDQ